MFITVSVSLSDYSLVLLPILPALALLLSILAIFLIGVWFWALLVALMIVGYIVAQGRVPLFGR
jgi:hypothetical protein